MVSQEGLVINTCLLFRSDLLKRHRDQWALNSESPEYRPISAVITTLAAKAYEKVYKESQAQALRPIEAIVKIIAYMPQFITQTEDGFAVLNPMDKGENFAEKWNRPGGEGRAYYDAFIQWHRAAREDVRLGLRDLGSDTAFREAFSRKFAVPETLITEVVRDLPGNWTRPGREAGLSRNKLSLTALSGGHAASAAAQENVQPTGRLG